MNAFLPFIFLTCGIMLAGNGLPYYNLLSKYENRDDYFEDYYLRKVPKLQTNPEEVNNILINQLSWFPTEELDKERQGGLKNIPKRQNYFVDLVLEEERMTSTSKPFNISGKIKVHWKKIKSFGDAHNIPTNWSTLKCQTCKSYQKVRNYLGAKHLKEVFKNATHPLRYRGPSKFFFNCSGPPKIYEECFKYVGPSVRIHPKSSHVEWINIPSTTEYPYFPSYPVMHFPVPRKIKVVIDLKNPEKPMKLERQVKDYSLAGVEGDNTNSSNVLEIAGEMASDLAGRVTSLWHCVLGSHRVPDTKDVKFYLYTRRNIIIPELLKVNYEIINRKVRENPQRVDVECIDLLPENIPGFKRVSDENREIIRSNFLNLRAPTKILIHGYTGSYKDSRMAKVKDAYLSSGRYNVIQVDWEILAAPPCYIRVTHHSKFVGEIIARFLDGLYLVGLNMSLVHLVGFSLGAQVAGFAGNNATIAPVCRITGLDPALPLFLHTDPSGHLDWHDAKFVDVIHTCGGILAMLDPLGHVDFYPNGGTRQPGCEFSNLKCSHSRAPQYFAESVVSKKKFTGQLCLSWEDYIAGNCNNNTNISFMGEPCSRSMPYAHHVRAHLFRLIELYCSIFLIWQPNLEPTTNGFVYLEYLELLKKVLLFFGNHFVLESKKHLERIRKILPSYEEQGTIRTLNSTVFERFDDKTKWRPRGLCL